MKHPRGIVASVEQSSPAMRAGICPGDAVLEVDGRIVRDVLDWRWETDGLEASLLVEREGSGAFEVSLEREPFEPWGLEFADPLFDGVMPCCNNCTFCFMKMLPADARPSLKERDDDYRLSFIQGNFVTFTNLDDEHVERIIEQNLSPLRFSLHSSNPSIRASMIGRRADHGLDVAQRLLDAGIELHAQIVLVPGANDGDKLEETLSWAWERPGIANVGIVPLGYTKHQAAFDRGFETAGEAKAVLETIEPFRERAIRQRGYAWAYASDEFYRKAYGESLLDNLPDAESYGTFELYEDGIGMVRSFVDDWNRCLQAHMDLAASAHASGVRVLLVTGEATCEFLDPLIRESPLAQAFEAIHVANDYFGGNVDVTGLLCGCDIAHALNAITTDGAIKTFAVVPETVFNTEGVTLDGMTLAEVSASAGMPVHVISCQPSQSFAEIAAIIETYRY